MRVCILASGSNGNATYFNSNGIGYLIDCGISYRALKERLNKFNVDIETVNNVIITHEHVDHVRGLIMLLKYNPNLIVYMTKGTYKGLRLEYKEALEGHQANFIMQNQSIVNNDTTLTFLRTHHDTYEPMALMVEEDDKRFVYITDTGYFEEAMFDIIDNPDLLIIESNYNDEILYSSNRPYELKERIASLKGHLSNRDSAVIISHIAKDKTKDIVLAHISDECNFYHMPALILKEHQDVYEELDFDYQNINFYIGNREDVTGEFNL